MPRPLINDYPLTRVNVMLDRESLEKAQRKAAKAGIDPGVAGSTSAFLRYLVERYIDGKSNEV